MEKDQSAYSRDHCKALLVVAGLATLAATIMWYETKFPMPKKPMPDALHPTHHVATTTNPTHHVATTTIKDKEVLSRSKKKKKKKAHQYMHTFRCGAGRHTRPRMMTALGFYAFPFLLSSNLLFPVN